MTRDKNFTFFCEEDFEQGGDFLEYRENVPYFFVEDGEDTSIITRLWHGVKVRGKAIDGKFVPLDEILENTP